VDRKAARGHSPSPGPPRPPPSVTAPATAPSLREEIAAAVRRSASDSDPPPIPTTASHPRASPRAGRRTSAPASTTGRRQTGRGRTDTPSSAVLCLCAVSRGPRVIKHRDVAQLGSALDWGSRGRRFKSCRPDGARGLRAQVRALFHSREARPLIILQARSVTICHTREPSGRRSFLSPAARPACPSLP